MAYAKTSERREKRLLREQMRSMGLGYRDIAAEFARRYKMRPRAAWREAYGWSLQDTADRINDFRGNTGLDPGGIAAMTAPHLSEYETWPGHRPEPSGRRPTPYLLAVLAAVYDCAVTDLIDLADRQHLRPADLLILDKYSQPAAAASTPETMGRRDAVVNWRARDPQITGRARCSPYRAGPRPTTASFRPPAWQRAKAPLRLVPVAARRRGPCCCGWSRCRRSNWTSCSFS